MKFKNLRASLYLIVGIALYCFFLSKLIYPYFGFGELANSFIKFEPAFITSISLMLIPIIVTFVSIYLNKDEAKSFHLARTISYWMIQIPLTAIISFQLLTFIMESTINPWTKAFLPAVIGSFSMLWLNSNFLRGKADVDYLKTKGNTSQRQITYSLVSLFCLNIVISTNPLVGDWFFITAFLLYYFATTVIYLRNVYKMHFNKYSNLVLSWVDPALPHATNLLVFYYIIIPFFTNWMTVSIGLGNTILIVNSIGVILAVFTISMHMMFNLSIPFLLMKIPGVKEIYFEKEENKDKKIYDVENGLVYKIWRDIRRANKK